MSESLFTKILLKKIPGDIVFENDRIFAINDINPQSPVHILIIPKEQITTLNDLKDEHKELLGEMFIVARDLAKEMGFDDDGYRAVINCNMDGGQSVYHIHLHLLAGRHMEWPPG
jgi:histidine triad (HIT) family protein